MNEALVQELLWLCAIASPTGGEQELCDRIEGRLRERAAVRRIGNSLVVRAEPPRQGPTIVLAGHLDVVRTEHEGPPRVEGDRVYGPGAADMKSGLSLMLVLLFGGAPPAAANVVYVFYAREEGPYAENELAAVLDGWDEDVPIDLAVLLEPSDNKLQLGAVGSLHAEVTFSGTTAHSARPWQGVNAIHQAGPLLCDLSTRAPREVEVGGLAYRTVTSVTLAEGGRARNIIPDRFRLNVNHRFAPGTAVEDAMRDVEALVGGRAEVKFVDVSPSALPFADHALVVALGRAGALAIEPKQAWTDVARFASRGVPAVNFGPGEQNQAHQRNEWTSASKLQIGYEILRRWLGSLAGP